MNAKKIGVKNVYNSNNLEKHIRLQPEFWSIDLFDTEETKLKGFYSLAEQILEGAFYLL